MQGDVGRREEHRFEARLRGGPPRAMARARCVRRRAQWRARGMRMACACAWRVRGVCATCAQRVRGVCISGRGVRRPARRPSLRARRAARACLQEEAARPQRGGGESEAGTVEGAAPRAVSAASVSRVRVQVRAPGEARASAVWRWLPRGSRGAKWGPRFSRAGTLVRSLTAAQRQHLVRLGRLGLWVHARRRLGR